MNDFTKDLTNGFYAVLSLAMDSPRLTSEERVELLYEIISYCDTHLDAINGRLAESGSS